jgi:hypothetical protein
MAGQAKQFKLLIPRPGGGAPGRFYRDIIPGSARAFCRNHLYFKFYRRLWGSRNRIRRARPGGPEL